MVTYHTETITPQMAQEYLRKNVGNRNLSMKTVKMYADLMKKGKWMLNAQTISFTDDGFLLDGQHRLQACILAEVPFVTSVATGVDKETFASIDCGRNRIMGQLVGMQGIKHYNIVAGAFNFAQSLITGQKVCGSNGKYKGVGYTNVEKMELFEQDKEEYIQAGSMARSLCANNRLMEASVVGGTIYYLKRICGYNENFIKTFFEGVLSFSSSSNSSIELLRKRLMGEKCGIKKTSRFILFALLIKTWNAYVIGKDVGCLRFNEEKEKYPEFIKIKN